MSRQWFRLLADRLDAVADALPRRRPGRGRRLAAKAGESGPLPAGSLRHAAHPVRGPLGGPAAPGADAALGQPALPAENPGEPAAQPTPHGDAGRWPTPTRPTAGPYAPWGTLTHHRATFVATEGELLAGDHRGVVWQQCGNGTELDLPVEVAPGVSLNAIMAWTDRRAGNSADSSRQRNPGAERPPRPDPETLYPDHLRAAMPEPSELLRSSLAVRLTSAEKDALDLLASWPLCTTDQLAGLMGGVTRRRVNQVLSSLAGHSLVRPDGQRHVLTDEGLRYLARRDRAAVGPVVGRWSASKAAAAQRQHPRSTPAPPCAPSPPRWSITTPSPASPQCPERREPPVHRDYQVLDLMPTSRSAVGYRWDWTNYVVHPDASFQLAYRESSGASISWSSSAGPPPPGGCAPAWRTTDGTSTAAGPTGTTAGCLHLVLFVFPNPDAEEGFLHGISGCKPPHPVHVQPPDP